MKNINPKFQRVKAEEGYSNYIANKRYKTFLKKEKKILRLKEALSDENECVLKVQNRVIKGHLFKIPNFK